MQVKIKYFSNDIPRIKKIEKGDQIDLYASEEVFIRGGEYKLIPLGVAMELPKGYEAIVSPRSSTFKNYGILMANSVGVIDNSYCGDNDQWHFPAYSPRYDLLIPKGAKICQFRIQKNQPKFEFVEVDSLGNEDRGGIGSTGK